jgi:hypothetical protein
MRRPRPKIDLIVTICVLFAACLSSASAFAGPGAKGPRESKLVNVVKSGTLLKIILDGRTLSGPNSSAEKRDDRIILPAGRIARALGIRIAVDLITSVITVDRQNGIITELDYKLGQVRKNGAVVLTFAISSEFALVTDAGRIMLTNEICSVLFDVSIVLDQNRGAVIISSSWQGQVLPVSQKSRRTARLYNLDYDLNLGRYSGAATQNLVLSGAGQIADGRFRFNSNSSSTPASSFINIVPRSGNFVFERPNAQRFEAGDLGTGTRLQFLTTNIRGAMASIPLNGFAVTAFGGRTRSGSTFPIADDEVRSAQRSRFDTGVAGLYVGRDSELSNWGVMQLSGGGMRFSGLERSGELLTGGLSFTGERFTMQADFAAGRFRRQVGDVQSNATASAIDLVGTLRLTESLQLQGRFENIGEQFINPQIGYHEPLQLKAAGVTWSPTKWLLASISGSSSRSNGLDPQRNDYVAAAFGVTPARWAPKVYFSHTQSSSTRQHASAFTLVNASKDFAKWRLFVNASRIKTAGPATLNSQFGANFAANERNSFEMVQGLGKRGAINGHVDWRTSNLSGKPLSLTVGGGYSHIAGSTVKIYERATAALRLPRQTSIQIDYLRAPGGPTLLMSIRGNLFHDREATAFLEAPTSTMNSYGKVAGRAYQDIDMNGRFDPGTDQPLADVKVRVDGSRYVVTDAEGFYRFDSLLAGDHRVSLDLLSVRADLTLLSGDDRPWKMAAGSESTIDFRLVRTGRVRGRVWLDVNGDGKFDDGDTPLAEIRIVTSGGRDTLSDDDGFYTIGDLAPGEYVTVADEKSLPEKTRVAGARTSIQVVSGKESGGADIVVTYIPAEVKRFGTLGL